jgi:hypothetical protein
MYKRPIVWFYWLNFKFFIRIFLLLYAFHRIYYTFKRILVFFFYFYLV